MKRVLEALVLMLSPMAPHIAEELWQMLGHETSLAREKWPAVSRGSDARRASRGDHSDQRTPAREDFRGSDLSEEETLNRALTDPRIAVLIAGKEITKTIVVPRKLVNIVLR